MLLRKAYKLSVIEAIILVIGTFLCIFGLYTGGLYLWSDKASMTIMLYLIPGFCYIMAMLTAVMQAEYFRRKSIKPRESLIVAWVCLIAIVCAIAPYVIMCFGAYYDGFLSTLEMSVMVMFGNGVGVFHVIAAPFQIIIIVMLNKMKKAEAKAIE